MSGGQVQIDLVASLGQFDAQMKVAAGALGQVAKAGSEMGAIAGRGLSETARASESAGKATQRLADGLRDYRSEQIAQARQARFFANELTAIIPASDSAKFAIQGLVGVGLEGLAGGMGIMLVIEGLKVGAELWRHFGDEAEAASKQAIESLGKIADSLADLDRKRLNVTAADQAEDAIRGAQRVLASRAAVQASLESNSGGLATNDDAARRLNALNAEIVAWEKINGKLEDFISLKGKELEALRLAETAKEVGTTLELQAEGRLLVAKTERQTAEAEFTNDVVAAQRKWIEGAYTQLQLELAINNAYVKRQLVIEKLSFRDLPTSGPGNDAGEFRFKADEEKSREAEAKRKRDRETDHRLSQSSWDAGEMPDLGGDSALRASVSQKSQIAEAEEAFRKFNATQQDAIAGGVLWGRTLGNALSGVITGTTSLGQAFAQMGQMAIQQLTELAIASVTASAAKAGGEAASSQAGIPIVGPALAIAAMGAMVGAVMGLLGNIGAKEMGGAVYPGGSYVVGEAGPEVLQVGLAGNVVPHHRLALDAAGGQGGTVGGGDTFYANFSLVDSRGFKAMLRANSKAVRDFMREERRSGRL